MRRRNLYLADAPEFLTPALLAQGRLALATGDPAGALRAWAHYLTLMNDAEESLTPQVEHVRRQVKRLNGGDITP